MSGVQKLLGRLQRVKQVAPNRWVGGCPCHNANGQALSIRELDDGRILMHDFGGCATTDILATLGLTASDLFPERLGHHFKPVRPNHWHARSEAFMALKDDVVFIALCADAVANNDVLSESDRTRAFEVAGRIRSAARMCA
ncbi:MAG: DNA primase [Steroidobacter sp.]